MMGLGGFGFFGSCVVALSGTSSSVGPQRSQVQIAEILMQISGIAICVGIIVMIVGFFLKRPSK